MTMPHLMNCPHHSEGHCIDCVKAEWEEREAKRHAIDCDRLPCQSLRNDFEELKSERDYFKNLCTESGFELRRRLAAVEVEALSMVKAEREACARLVESMREQGTPRLAAAIRARGGS